MQHLIYQASSNADIRFNSRHPLKTSYCHQARYKTRSITSYACHSSECLGSIYASSCKGTKDNGTWAPRRTRASDASPDWSSSYRPCRNSCKGMSPSGISDNPPSAHLKNKRTREPGQRASFVDAAATLSREFVHNVRLEKSRLFNDVQGLAESTRLSLILQTVPREVRVTLNKKTTPSAHILTSVLG